MAGIRVCVTGGAGYVAALLVKKLLAKGYTVNATLRDLSESSKVDMLKRLGGAEKRLVLFEANLYEPHSFEPAIEGCKFVLHVATPMLHSDGFKFKNMREATVASARSIIEFCVRSGTVEKLIYTSSLITASPAHLKQHDDDDDGVSTTAYNLDESCWTPHGVVTSTTHGVSQYAESKMLAERDILSYRGKGIGKPGVEIVTLPCGLIGGDNTISSSIPTTVWMFVSPILDSDVPYNYLRSVEEPLRTIPIVHVDDVCEAHMFCMENPQIHGRFFCASDYMSPGEIAAYYQQNYPQFHIKPEYLLDVPKTGINWDFSKLKREGFKYRYDAKATLADCIACGTRFGILPQK